LEEIEADVFSQTGLQSLNLPENIAKIGSNFFCTEKLTEITIPTTNRYYRVYKEFLVSADQKLLLWASRSLKEATLWRELEIIGDFAFYQARQLRSIDFAGAKITEIGAYAFGFTNLVKFIMPVTVKRIGDGAFTNCSKMTEFQMWPNAAVTQIGSNAFNMTAFEQIDLPPD
jgi:hypothetical protein